MFIKKTLYILISFSGIFTFSCSFISSKEYVYKSYRGEEIIKIDLKKQECYYSIKLNPDAMAPRDYYNMKVMCQANGDTIVFNGHENDGAIFSLKSKEVDSLQGLVFVNVNLLGDLGFLFGRIKIEVMFDNGKSEVVFIKYGRDGTALLPNLGSVRKISCFPLLGGNAGDVVFYPTNSNANWFSLKINMDSLYVDPLALKDEKYLIISENKICELSSGVVFNNKSIWIRAKDHLFSK